MKTSLIDYSPAWTKNYIINSNFDFWQRGTTVTASNNIGYVADRWFWAIGASGTATCSRQAFTTGQTLVPNNPVYFLRYNCTVGAASSNRIAQRIESVTTLAGKTVTVSFYAQSAVAGKQINVSLNQNFGSGGSGGYSTSVSTITLTTSWAPYTCTFTLPTLAGKTIGSNSYLELYLCFPWDSSTYTIDIAQVMLNEGSVAAPFCLAGGDLIGELAKCQRYYEKSFEINESPADKTDSTRPNCVGYVQTVSQVEFVIPFRVSKRTNNYQMTFYKTLSSESANQWSVQTGGGFVYAGSTSANDQHENHIVGRIIKSSSYTVGIGCALFGQWTCDAEL